MRIPKHYLAELKLGEIKNSTDGKKYMHGMTLVKDVPDKRDFRMDAMSVNERLELPNYVNWTSKMSPVKDQGNLGSCVGFACAAMKEFQEQAEHEREVAEGKKYRRERDHYDLSEAWIYWNSKKIDPWPNEEGTDEDDFFDAETVREAILTLYPQVGTGKDKFGGITYILTGYDGAEPFTELKTFQKIVSDSNSREEAVRKLIPSYDDTGRDVTVEIIESTPYKNVNDDSCRFNFNSYFLHLTELGYIFERNCVTSNSPSF